ncbi:MAG: methylenetetrahydrofolate reductase [Desulfococcaceae bacterium]|jgi:5,10-methylenetetrahydrofolate reductase|nr:methylenetetrahydrofolate reductase [Desulfococcaceae bacterium]
MGLKKKLESGEFAVLAEMEPPKGTDISLLLENAEKIREHVDAIVVSEMNNAVMRMSALAGAMLLQQKGLESILQICTRDRNRLALQADLLGAGAAGVSTVIITSGDDPALGDHHQALAVNDITSAQLAELIGTLQQGQDMAGAELTGSPSFGIAATVRILPEGEAQEKELMHMDQMIKSGSEFLITQPLFDPEIPAPYLEKAAAGNVRIFPTVLLLKSLGMARYMERNVKHIFISKDLIKRIQKSKDKEGECTRIAGDLLGLFRQKGMGGVVLNAAGWEHKIPEIITG